MLIEDENDVSFIRDEYDKENVAMQREVE